MVKLDFKSLLSLWSLWVSMLSEFVDHCATDFYYYLQIERVQMRHIINYIFALNILISSFLFSRYIIIILLNNLYWQIWDLRILHIKSVLFSILSNLFLFPFLRIVSGQVCSLDSWIKSILQWYLSLSCWDSPAIMSSSYSILFSSLCCM